MSEDNTVFGGGEIEETVVKPIRSGTNLRHNSYPEGHTQEIVSPPFNSGTGYYAINDNDKFAGGYTDFNYKKCTGGTSNWKFKWLLGKSEYKAKDSMNKEAPPEYSRNDYSMSNGDNGGSDHGSRSKKLFSARTEPSGVKAVSRSNCNLNQKYWWGITDYFKYKSGYTEYDHGKNKTAYYCRAKGITFRYKSWFYEDTQVFDKDKHGFTPLLNFYMFFTGREDNYVYCAELIAGSKNWVKNGSKHEYTMGALYGASAGGYSGERHPVGETHYDNDWEIKYTPTGEGAKQKSVMGGGPWDEHSEPAHQIYYVPAEPGNGDNPSSFPRNNRHPSVVNGCASLTLSSEAAAHVWDHDMVCVGFAACSATTNRKVGTIGSDMNFYMWDTKLLESEKRGDASLKGGDILNDSQYVAFSTIMQKPCTVKEKSDFYHSLRTGNNPVNVELDQT